MGLSSWNRPRKCQQLSALRGVKVQDQGCSVLQQGSDHDRERSVLMHTRFTVKTVREWMGGVVERRACIAEDEDKSTLEVPSDAARVARGHFSCPNLSIVHFLFFCYLNPRAVLCNEAQHHGWVLHRAFSSRLGFEGTPF